MISLQLGCSHSGYKAEVDGAGAKADVKTHVGVIYLIPPNSSQLRMKIVSLGISTDKEKNPTLRMRLYFARKNVAVADPGAKRNKVMEYLNPAEQAIILPKDATEIHPNRTFSNPVKKPLIELVPNQRQVIELLFPLPAQIKSNDDLEKFSFSWKVHYSKHKTEQQVTQFDRFDAQQENNAEFMTDPDYPDFPIHEYMEYPADYEWAPAPFGWWW
jgi:hypothetical protein